MKKLIAILALLGSVLIWFAEEWRESAPTPSAQVISADDERLAAAFADHRKNFAVHGAGVVTKLLPDDTNGIQHQRFVVRLASGQTLLIAHNISIASRIDSLKAGDAIEFRGVYEWNPQGGVIHWTHRDRKGQHDPGWLKHQSGTYQ